MLDTEIGRLLSELTDRGGSPPYEADSEVQVNVGSSQMTSRLIDL
jgi:hypothetical protein